MYFGVLTWLTALGTVYVDFHWARQVLPDVDET